MALSRRNSLFSLTVSGAESSVMIQTLIETARANGADPYYYLKYLMEQMPKHLYEKGREYMPEMTPWSEKYRQYETWILLSIRIVFDHQVRSDTHCVGGAFGTS